ncbi:hypothetical protein L1267_17945 [Pseudoalteromonas sp. OFAV1]|uniref:hypothetical protein n=1 Tax=Pseudoalteromonas sp. OFAV1 TaxID=2908892 RepID=UPI001F24A94C|nr:hypothetical protein [Pseudoalteromonas sp. OFAV1]MCF2902255.1 hypothetical protein [Pseudoalteromonas sp. OFAV1]
MQQISLSGRNAIFYDAISNNNYDKFFKTWSELFNSYIKTQEQQKIKESEDSTFNVFSRLKFVTGHRKKLDIAISSYLLYANEVAVIKLLKELDRNYSVYSEYRLIDTFFDSKKYLNENDTSVGSTFFNLKDNLECTMLLCALRNPDNVQFHDGEFIYNKDVYEKELNFNCIQSLIVKYQSNDELMDLLANIICRNIQGNDKALKELSAALCHPLFTRYLEVIPLYSKRLNSEHANSIMVNLILFKQSQPSLNLNDIKDISSCFDTKVYSSEALLFEIVNNGVNTEHRCLATVTLAHADPIKILDQLDCPLKIAKCIEMYDLNPLDILNKTSSVTLKNTALGLLSNKLQDTP